jgi:hypothetical protein
MFWGWPRSQGVARALPWADEFLRLWRHRSHETVGFKIFVVCPTRGERPDENACSTLLWLDGRLKSGQDVRTS